VDPLELPGYPQEWAGEQLNTRMGVQILEAIPQRVVGTVPVKGNRQPYGLLHGGANAVLAETLGSIAAALNAGPGQAVVGIDVHCTHHRAATEGVVTGVCTPLHVGRSVSSFEIVVNDAEGRRTCTARLTCIVRDRPPGQL
jgi:1,4-dihydroxy-2-naphthoyl-CoA hydrolase